MIEKLDPIEAWKSLPADQQELFGAAAISHMQGMIGNMALPGMGAIENAEHAYQAADLEAGRRMESIMLHYLEPKSRPNGQFLIPDLSKLGIRVCQSCGCTDRYACEDRCWWIADDLCSNCKPKDQEMQND